MTIIFGKNELMTENMLPDGGKIKSITSETSVVYQ